jgi:hypothetical protein
VELSFHDAGATIRSDVAGSLAAASCGRGERGERRAHDLAPADHFTGRDFDRGATRFGPAWIQTPLLFARFLR